MADEARWRKMMRCIVGRPQESIKGCNHIHSLCDELLLEILRRLPDCKSVVQCKCVCKRWAALASHPGFFHQFIRLKLGDSVRGTGDGGMKLNKEHQTSAIVMQYECFLSDLYQEFESFLSPSIFHVHDSSFSRLHCLGDDNASDFVLVASCQDLLLYCKHENDNKYNYYISNVQTRQYVTLPSPPRFYSIRLLHVGFICDPFHSCGREILINAAYHYSVVVIDCAPRSSTKLSVHLFSSYCGNQWCNKVLSLPKTFSLWTPEAHDGFCFCFDRKLHFIGEEGFFGFDHNSIEFDDEIQCHLVEWPVGLFRGNHRVGVSQGSLHLSAFRPAFLSDTSTVYVWVHDDYKASNWMLQHRVDLSDCVPRKPWMTKKLKKFSLYQGQFCYQVLVNVLGFHPSSSDVVYLHVPGCIFLCNLSTKTVELACRIPEPVAKTYRRYLSKFYAFPVIYQSWPTPLPPLAQGLKVGANTTPTSCFGSQALG